MMEKDNEMFMEIYGAEINFVKETLDENEVEYVDLGTVNYFAGYINEYNYKRERLNDFADARLIIECQLKKSRDGGVRFIRYALYLPHYKFNMWISDCVGVKYVSHCCSEQFVKGDSVFRHTLAGWDKDDLVKFIRTCDELRPERRRFFEVSDRHPKVVG